MIQIETYKKLNNVAIKNRPPKSYFPNPTQFDYNIGYIKRYFTQRRGTSGSPIFEINGDSFSDYSNTDYWNGVELNWKIVGNLDDRYTDDGSYVPSVKSINRLAITEAAKKLPDIELYLVNLSQFYK
jgi:hypothetical protein